MATPVMKWPGGKRQLLPELLRLKPPSWKTYVEPMVGGGALFFDLEPKPAKIGDLNHALVNVYREIRDRPDNLIEALKQLDALYWMDPKQTYYDIRELFNADRDNTVHRAARMLFLNRTCFNGLWRVNRKGGFNVPYGKYKSPKIVREELLREASVVLQDVEIVSDHYMGLLMKTNPGDFVYLDPPYVPLNPTSSFTSFTKEGFGEDHQRALAAAVEELVENGVQVMVSNSDTPFCHGLYRRFPRVRVQARRSINSKGNKRGPVNELIVLAGYDPPEDVEALTDSGL